MAQKLNVLKPKSQRKTDYVTQVNLCCLARVNHFLPQVYYTWQRWHPHHQTHEKSDMLHFSNSFFSRREWPPIPERMLVPLPFPSVPWDTHPPDHSWIWTWDTPEGSRCWWVPALWFPKPAWPSADPSSPSGRKWVKRAETEAGKENTMYRDREHVRDSPWCKWGLKRHKSRRTYALGNVPENTGVILWKAGI